MLCFDLRKKVKGKNTFSSDSKITLLLVVEIGVEKGCISEKTLDINICLIKFHACSVLLRTKSSKQSDK